MTMLAEDEASVRAWFEALAAHVRAVDFADARRLFLPDVIGFGTFTDFVDGLAAIEAAQWRNVWPHIDGFTWRPGIRAIVSADRLQAVGMGVWDSTGYDADGAPYTRPGRATVVLTRDAVGSPWRAAHTHFSLFRDIPTRSFKGKPEAAPR
jgi:ketosteroid isomerase-like protein